MAALPTLHVQHNVDDLYHTYGYIIAMGLLQVKGIFIQNISTHRHHGHTPVLQLGNKLVSIPVLVVDAGPHLNSQRSIQHLHHPPDDPLKPSVSAHQSRPSSLDEV